MMQLFNGSYGVYIFPAKCCEILHFHSRAYCEGKCEELLQGTLCVAESTLCLGGKMITDYHISSAILLIIFSVTLSQCNTVCLRFPGTYLFR